MAPLAGLRRVNVPLFLKLQTDLLLRLTAAGFPIQVKDLIDRTQIIFRMPVAVQAPPHRKRFFLVNNVHVVDLTVATHATDAAINVYRMIEIREVRHLVNFYPVDRISALPTLSHGGQFRIVGLNLRMTIHAGLSSGNIRVG